MSIWNSIIYDGTIIKGNMIRSCFMLGSFQVPPKFVKIHPNYLDSENGGNEDVRVRFWMDWFTDSAHPVMEFKRIK